MQANLEGTYGADKFIRIGFAVIGIVFGGLILWSIVAPIEGAVIAAGQVVVQGNRKTVQHYEGGVVAEILVEEGDVVKKGDILVRLDSTASGASLGLIDDQLSELYARRARFVAERDNAEGIAPPDGIASVISADGFKKNYAGQRELLEARRNTRNRQISLLNEQINQQRRRIEGLTAKRQSVITQFGIITDELQSVRTLYEQGFAPLTRVRALEREKERLSGERGSLTSALAEVDSVISTTILEIERLKEAMREEAIAELRDVEAQIDSLEERRVAVIDTFERTNIVAPQDGQVMALNVHTIGGVIAPGGAILSIVPNQGNLEIAARVSPRDIEKVAPNQEVLIRFSAFSARIAPSVDGSIKTVSGDSMVDEVTGAPYYLVLISIPNDEQFQKKLAGKHLMPGMPLEAYIRTGKQPAISYILRPLTDSLARSMRDE